jgi:hypothetical protein
MRRDDPILAARESVIASRFRPVVKIDQRIKTELNAFREIPAEFQHLVANSDSDFGEMLASTLPPPVDPLEFPARPTAEERERTQHLALSEEMFGEMSNHDPSHIADEGKRCNRELAALIRAKTQAAVAAVSEAARRGDPFPLRVLEEKHTHPQRSGLSVFARELADIGRDLGDSDSPAVNFLEYLATNRGEAAHSVIRSVLRNS